MRWHRNYLCDLHWHFLDRQEYVLFNAASRQTHQLNQLAVDTLELLDGQELDEEKICAQLAELYENLNLGDAKAHDYVLAMLADLDEIGLIEPYTA